MVGVIEAYEMAKGIMPSREYFFFDSFEGFKRTYNDTLDSKFNEMLHKWTQTGRWAAGRHGVDDLTFVRKQFDSVGLLLPRVHFVKGFFEHTMPHLAISRSIAVLRMDGDLYGSTSITLQCLYPSVNLGGVVIVDDYNWHPQAGGNIYPCRQAVNDYRKRHAIHDTREAIEVKAVPPFWKKYRNVTPHKGECVVGS